MLRALVMTGLLALAMAGARVDAARADAPNFSGGLIPDPKVKLPDGQATSTVFLFSNGAWGDQDDALATRLRDDGAAVVGVDTNAYFAALDASGKGCVYLVADFERLGHEIQRATGTEVFRPPVIAGAGVAGALVLDILSQTPADTLSSAVSVDPAAGIPLQTPLCTKAQRSDGPAGAAYALPSGPLPAVLTVVQSTDAAPDVATRTAALSKAGTEFEARTVTDDITIAFEDAVSAAVSELALGDDTSVVELPATVKHNAMAIVLSGDGGWRDIDKTLAGILQDKGIPTVGLDTLRWFWKARTPEETAEEITQLIDAYSETWGVDHVLLIGYSFGAGVIPAAVLAMPPEEQAKLVQISLLAPQNQVDWEISVTGWLGGATDSATPIAGPLAALPLDRVQCIYGQAESESACPSLEGTAAEIISTSGGHHFDGDYPKLAEKITAGLDRRLKGQ